jgi:hypothetical protein
VASLAASTAVAATEVDNAGFFGLRERGVDSLFTISGVLQAAVLFGPHSPT